MCGQDCGNGQERAGMGVVTWGDRCNTVTLDDRQEHASMGVCCDEGRQV